MSLALLFASAMLGSAATATGMLGVVSSFSSLEEAPEWCKNETELTWQQRKERMQQHATLQWAKKQAAKLREENQTIPEWMDKIVTDDENRGKLKWAVSEVKRLKAEGKETPEWMIELVKEDDRWSNRWAACKAHELKVQNQEVPQWMVDNARKGIMDYASEKAAEIQEQIREVEVQKERDDAVVQANGDIEEANHRLLWRAREAKRMTCASQLNVLEGAMESFHDAEEKAKEGAIRFPALRRAGTEAQAATAMMSVLLERKLAMIQSGIEAGLS
mmetsp:Transcript_95697/g.252852  ORF Transcript_95697/g.252852 Transcript_95697/m.252852 type:complete len:275 (+) Transcript_95697:96-920(+)